MKKILIFLFLIGLIFTEGKTMAEEILSAKQKNIVQIASYSAIGDMDKLDEAIKEALKSGLTVNEAKEVFVQMYAYCGFPRSLNALSALLKVSKEGDFENGPEGKALSRKDDKNKIGEKIQTELAGQPVKGELFDFAPAIDDYLKEHLFGDIFSRGVLSNQEREIATIAALSSMKDVEPQLKAHIAIGKNTGLSDNQIAEILILTSRPKVDVFGLGEKNEAYAKYFKGQSYLKPLTNEQLGIANVTFEPECRNNWHIHHKGGQILLVTGGRGYYQEWGKEAQELKEGDAINIAPEVKHWHGAAKDSWFSHVAIAVPSEGGSTEWLEEVSDEEYQKLK